MRPMREKRDRVQDLTTPRIDGWHAACFQCRDRRVVGMAFFALQEEISHDLEF
jgi:hypothetical protein